FVWQGHKLEPTLANVVDALRERYNEANIVLSPGLAKLKISDLKLRGGRLMENLEAIRVASGGKFDWTSPGVQGGPAMVDPATGLPASAAVVEPNTGLFILRDPAPTPETERMVE